MIGLDSNILLRLLLKDDEDQLSLVKDLLETHCTQDNPGLIHLPVVVELIWVMLKVYKVDKHNLIVMLNDLLDTVELAFEERDIVKSSLEEYGSRSSDLADLIIGKYYRKLGCGITATFDKKAAKLREFTLVENA